MASIPIKARPHAKTLTTSLYRRETASRPPIRFGSSPTELVPRDITSKRSQLTNARWVCCKGLGTTRKLAQCLTTWPLVSRMKAIWTAPNNCIARQGFISSKLGTEITRSPQSVMSQISFILGATWQPRRSSIARHCRLMRLSTPASPGTFCIGSPI